MAYLAICFAVRRAGGLPLKLTTGMSWRDTELSALIIGGGSDVFPEHYNQAAVEGATYDQNRDEMEMYWARKARDGNIPTLGICRGAQVMNVAHGGSLHQELSKVYDDVDYPSTLIGHAFYRKKVTIKPDSLLGSITRHRSLRVNSIHKQAIDEVGKDFVISAVENNGVIQAIEDETPPFLSRGSVSSGILGL